MRVSVAMATFNGAGFLADQLESIVRQSRPPDELIVCDDCSTDETVDHAEAFAAGAPFDVVVLRNERRLGYADNYFRAISECTGDVIALCDQDDVWHSDKLSVCIDAIVADADVSLVIHSARVVDECLRPIWSDPRNDIRRHVRYAPGTLGPVPRLRSGFTMVFRSVYVRGAAVDTRPRFVPDDTARMPHDAWITLVCGALGAVILLPEPLALYRRHVATATESWSGHLTTPRRGDRSVMVGLIRECCAAWTSSLELREEERSYVERGCAMQERAEYLETLGPLALELGPGALSGLDRAIRSHRRYARNMEARAALYSDGSPPQRIGRLARHTIRGDYGSRVKGGLGCGSFARDMFIGLVRR